MPKDELDLSEVTKSVGEVKSAFEQFKAAAEEREKELLKKGDVDPLVEEKLAKINAEVQKHQELLDKVHLATKRLNVTVDGKAVDREELDRKALAWAQANGNRRGVHVEAYTHENAQEYKRAFQSYLKKDDRVLSADELKALSAGSDPNGGYVVDPDTSGRIVTRQFDTSPMRAYASVQVISTDALEGMYDLNEATSGWVSETESRPETSTPQLGVWRIPVHEQYAAPRATQKVLDDAYIDLEAWLAGKIADKFTRTENAAFVNGNGVGKPRGFLTYPSGTTNPGQIETTNSGANGAFVAAPNSGDVLINTQTKLKTDYRRNATWFMNRVTMGGVRLLKNSDGAYLWQPSIQVGQPSTLLGDPVAPAFEDMPSYTTTGAAAIAYGDMAAAYQIVDRQGIRVLRDPYTAKPWIIFYSIKRIGGDVINFEAIKTIVFAN